MCSTGTAGGEGKKAELPGVTRRRKRDKEGCYVLSIRSPSLTLTTTTRRPKNQSKSKQKHGQDGPSGGMEALIPSLIGLCILGGAIMAKMGFRGRASVAGIDLGTTNSVICVQAPSKGGRRMKTLLFERVEIISSNLLLLLLSFQSVSSTVYRIR